MPTIEENRYTWDGDYQWPHQGDEWSAPWGSPALQWSGTLYPRIISHVPAHRILEIACGYGRWTQFLKDLCDELIVIDLSEECIEGCRKRFSDETHIEYHVNDGKSLDMIPDGSIDFIFSFDSLVHAGVEVLDNYLAQFPRILTPEGVAVLHHSNLHEYQRMLSRIRRVPKLEGVLRRLHLLDQTFHWRDPGVDAKKVEKIAETYGLQCINQEVFPWDQNKAHIDCLSTLVKSDSSLARPNRIWRNADFMQEARNLLQISRLYHAAR